jgi:adenine phosphoribosyltransferase
LGSSTARLFAAQQRASKRLKEKFRIIPNWPREGVNFVDITTVLKDSGAFKMCVDVLSNHFKSRRIDAVLGIEARGFMIAAPVAYRLGIGLVPARKKDKLPWTKHSLEYALEYGKETLELHSDSISKGQRIAILDDLLATGGTSLAAAKLVKKMGGKVAGLGFLVELDFLHGRDKLGDYDVFSLVHFEN